MVTLMVNTNDESVHLETVSHSLRGVELNNQNASKLHKDTLKSIGHVHGTNFKSKHLTDDKKDLTEDKPHDLEIVSSTDNVSVSMFSGCENAEYNTKILTTVLLLWEIVAMGCVYGLMGPTLPDLRLLSNSSLEQATWLFTGFSIGYLIGCFTSGVIGKRISQEGTIVVCTFLCSISAALLPWMPNLIGMVIVRVAIGVSVGGQDTGTHSLVFKVWGSNGGPVLQLLHVVFAIGGVASPLLAKPFLIEKSYDNNTTNISECTTLNSLMNRVNHTTDQNLLGQATTQLNKTRCDVTLNTNVHYAYLITGVILLSSALSFLILIIHNNRREKKATSTLPHVANKDEIKGNNSKLKVTQLCLLCIISYLATSLIDLFPNLLTTFVMSELNWTQQSSATLTSVFFIAYAVGNFFHMFTLLRISTTKIISLSYVCSIITLSCFVVGVFTKIRMLMWISVSTFSLSFSAIIPTIYTWTQKYVTPITSTISSSLLVSGSLGIMVNPVLIGYLMDNISALWFVYISCGEAVLCFIIFCIVISLRRLETIVDTSEGDVTITRF